MGIPLTPFFLKSRPSFVVSVFKSIIVSSTKRRKKFGKMSSKPPLMISPLSNNNNGAPDAAHSSWEFPEGTGVGETTNPSDLVSQGLDSKSSSNSTLRLRFRIKSGLPSVVSAAVSNEAAKNNGWDAVL